MGGGGSREVRVQALLEKSQEFELEGRVEEAQDLAKKAIEAATRNGMTTESVVFDAHSTYARILTELGAYDEAIANYSIAYEISTDRLKVTKALYVELQSYVACCCGWATALILQADRSSNADVEDELHASAEDMVLRCVEAVEEGHSRRSDLLVQPLEILAKLYSLKGLHGRAEMLMRRCAGIQIVQYGHDHPQLTQTRRLLGDVSKKKEEADFTSSVIKVQSIVRMFAKMRWFEQRTGKKPSRHIAAPKQRKGTIAGTTKQQVSDALRTPGDMSLMSVFEEPLPIDDTPPEFKPYQMEETGSSPSQQSSTEDSVPPASKVEEYMRHRSYHGGKGAFTLESGPAIVELPMTRTASTMFIKSRMWAVPEDPEMVEELDGDVTDLLIDDVM